MEKPLLEQNPLVRFLNTCCLTIRCQTLDVILGLTINRNRNLILQNKYLGDVIQVASVCVLYQVNK